MPFLDHYYAEKPIKNNKISVTLNNHFLYQ